MDEAFIKGLEFAYLYSVDLNLDRYFFTVFLQFKSFICSIYSHDSGIFWVASSFVALDKCQIYKCNVMYLGLRLSIPLLKS